MIENVFGKEAFFEVADGFIAMRAVLLEQTCLMLAHAAGDFLDGFIESRIHVLAFGVCFDGDVIGTEKDDFRDVAVFLNIENDLGLDDPRVIEVQTFDFFMGMISECISHMFVSHGDGDWQIHICNLHDCFWFAFGVCGWLV